MIEVRISQDDINTYRDLTSNDAPGTGSEVPKHTHIQPRASTKVEIKE